MPLTPCRDCVFFIKAEYQVKATKLRGAPARSECRKRSQGLTGSYEYGLAFNWPEVVDDDPGCGDGEEAPDAE